MYEPLYVFIDNVIYSSIKDNRFVITYLFGRLALYETTHFHHVEKLLTCGWTHAPAEMHDV